MEAYGDWVAFNEVRDAYAGYIGSCGDMAAYRRRLAAPTPSGNESAAHVAPTRRTSADAGVRRHLCTGVAYLSGRWSEIAPFSAVVDKAWEERRHDSRPGLLTVAYISPMRVARPRRTTQWLSMRRPRRWGAVVVCCDYRMSESRGRCAMIRCASRPAYNGLHLQSMLPRRWAQEAQPDNGKVKQIAVPAI